jgi:hypothetical protein
MKDTDVLGRFLTLYDHLRRTRTWRDDWTVLRHAAMTLPLLERDPAALAREFRETCLELRRSTRWWQEARGSVRYFVAASILRQREPVAGFLADLERVRALFRAARLPRGATSEIQAFVLLREGVPGGHVGAAHVSRMRDLYQAIRKDHRWLLGAGEYPTIALLSTTEVAAGEIARRVEEILRDLERRGFRRRGQLMPPSQLLFLSPERDDEACARFARMWKAFRGRNLRMHAGDYDEVALLTLLPLAAETVVRAVLEDRGAVATLRPRPSRDVTFSLACSTAYARLVGGDEKLRRLAHVQAAIQIRSIIVARQAAAAAAAG